MNDIESRLADALAARAEEVEPKDEHDALEHITRRINVTRRRGLTIVGIAAGIAVLVGAFALLRRDDGHKQQVNVSNDTTTTATTAKPTPGSVIPQATTNSIWPFVSSNRTFDSADAAAKSFAVEYLGMTNARVGTTTGNNVEVFPNANATTRTVVRVENQGDRGWAVLGSSADDATVDQPAPHSALTPTLTVSGRSVAFEAQIVVELRPYGSTNQVARTTAMGGSTEVQPYSATISPPSTDQPLVLLVYEPDASGQGAMSYATVVPLESAGGREPSQFAAVEESGKLMLLDFDGHLQRELASGATQVVATSRAVAYNTSTSCGPIRVVDTNGSEVFTVTGTGPWFSADGLSLVYSGCSDGLRHTRELATGSETTASPGDIMPANVFHEPWTYRGRFGTIALWNGSDIASYNTTTGAVVKLVTPAAAPISLDADDSGRYLLWVDANHDLWKWSGGDPVKVGTGFISAAW